MIKKRWLKHLLAGLCLLMAIPAFAQEKYFIRVSDYMNSQGVIDSVSNLCKLNPTYGSYATGEYTYPGSLPRASILVKCFMERPNSTTQSFGMDIFCPEGISHRSMVGIENGLEEGCYKIGEPPQPPKCPTQGQAAAVGYVYGLTTCNDHDTKVCVWIDNLPKSPLDPIARDIIEQCATEHESIHQQDYLNSKAANDGKFYCAQVDEFDENVVRGNAPWGNRSEISGYTAERDCLARNRSRCDTEQCRTEIDRHEEAMDKTIANYESNLCTYVGITCP